MADRREKRNYTATRPTDLPDRFVPHFLSEADGRFAAIRELRRRLARLKQDAGIDSYQKEILAERAVFIVCKLETAEVLAATGQGAFDAGVYTQQVNCLLGLLKALGLQRHTKAVANLREYVAEQQKRK